MKDAYRTDGPASLDDATREDFDCASRLPPREEMESFIRETYAEKNKPAPRLDGMSLGEVGNIYQICAAEIAKRAGNGDITRN